MISPRPVARAKLLDAASVHIDDRPGRRLGALVQIIRDAVGIAVEWKDLAAYLVVGQSGSLCSCRSCIHVPFPRQQFADLFAAEKKPALVVCSDSGLYTPRSPGAAGKKPSEVPVIKPPRNQTAT